ncbi:hypothetical protein BGW39_011592, partial [Mortierella sp. 14UC]
VDTTTTTMTMDTRRTSITATTSTTETSRTTMATTITVAMVARPDSTTMSTTMTTLRTALITPQSQRQLPLSGPPGRTTMVPSLPSWTMAGMAVMEVDTVAMAMAKAKVDTT